MNVNSYQVFRRGSKTYFYSSLFFPNKIRDEVAVLYRFVRILDDLVDSNPPQKELFYDYWDKYKKALAGKKSKIEFIDSFVELSRRKRFKTEWTEAFWKSMEMDLTKPIHKDLRETEEYMFGSAEVIGLLMAKTLKLTSKAFNTARMLGKAMQYANFIRDVAEDWKMGRNYLQVKMNKADYLNKLSLYKERFDKWQKMAEEGYRYLPKRYLIPIKTAAEMYKWTIEEIFKNPEVVFEKKVKPSIGRILTTGLAISLEK